MEKVDIYIKPVEKVQIIQKRDVLLRDVAEVFAGGRTKGEVEKLVVFQIPSDRKKTYLLSVMDLIQSLSRKYPNASVSNLGEMDILVEYLPRAEKKMKLWTLIKVAFVSLILFDVLPLNFSAASECQVLFFFFFSLCGLL